MGENLGPDGEEIERGETEGERLGVRRFTSTMSRLSYALMREHRRVKKRREPKRYRYDASSRLCWTGRAKPGARVSGEWLLGKFGGLR